MTIWQKSLLLMLLRARLEGERTADWRGLHRRDRGWFLSHGERRRWRLLADWLSQWEVPRLGVLSLLIPGLSAVALLSGFSLMAALLEFLPHGRINLLWFLLIGVALPALWWLLALLLPSAQVPLPLHTLVQRRLPKALGSAAPELTLAPLLGRTVLLLGQALSLLFAIGMVAAFVLYLAVTDLAFGWSSTLAPGGDWLHQITSLLSLPWSQLWPAAVPTLELVELSHHLRATPADPTQAARLGEWWRFLLMSLISYVLLPRLLSTAVHYLRLGAMQRRLIEGDALIGGLWQRLTTEWVDHDAEVVKQREAGALNAPVERGEGHYERVVSWGIWPEGTLDGVMDGGTRLAIEHPDDIDAALTRLREQSGGSGLLLCKGWEPPTGELADLCARLAGIGGRWLLQPIPLEGMDEVRRQALMASWIAFMEQLPGEFHLIDGMIREGDT